jgi:hypothetical protein
MTSTIASPESQLISDEVVAAIGAGASVLVLTKSLGFLGHVFTVRRLSRIPFTRLWRSTLLLSWSDEPIRAVSLFEEAAGDVKKLRAKVGHHAY